MSETLNRLPHEQALAQLRAACAAGDRSPVTILNLAIARDHIGEHDDARAMMRKIAELLPDWDEPWLRLAESWRREGHTDRALKAYGEVLERNPRRHEALVAKGAILLQQHQPDQARSILLRGVGVNPDNPEAWDALGLALTRLGDIAMAESAFAEASRLQPQNVDFALHRVEAAASSGRIEAEIARLQAATAADPLNVASLTALALALDRSGQCRAAADMAQAAAILAPDMAQPVTLAGVLLARGNRLHEAEELLRKAVALDPNHPAAGNDHAAVLMRIHRHAEARLILTRLLDRTGPSLDMLCNLATAETSLGLQEQGTATARRAAQLFPESAAARRTLLNNLPYRDGVTGEEMLSAARELSARLDHPLPPRLMNDPTPDRRLRIGLLSGTMRTHPVGWLTIAGFENLDPARYTLIGLAQREGSDPIARRFRAIAPEWHDVSALDDASLAALCRDNGIDILIDLGGFGDAGRITAFTHRSAPVQIKWVGMQTHSSGLPETEWMITDRWQTPAGSESLYSERLLRLPEGYVCYSPPPYAPDPAPLPARRNGHVTFGCFNNMAKITPAALATWSTILHQLPSAQLVLKTHQFSEAEPSERIRAVFASSGISPDRVQLRGSSRHRELLSQYNDIDIVLDPFPYSGGLTTCEALWMGVPTVTLPGDTFSSRHSVSHMSNVGLSDWVATDRDDYVRLACARASDLDALEALRATLRIRVKASPLCDAPRFGANLGAALRDTWHAWCGERELTARQPRPRILANGS